MANATMHGQTPLVSSSSSSSTPFQTSSPLPPSRRAASPVHSKTLADCFRKFTSAETLAESEVWYCPTCKVFQQATKKLDLWRLPNVLIIHLKRFRTTRDKITTPIDFPLHGLDMSLWIADSKKHSTEEHHDKPVFMPDHSPVMSLRSDIASPPPLALSFMEGTPVTTPTNGHGNEEAGSTVQMQSVDMTDEQKRLHELLEQSIEKGEGEDIMEVDGKIEHMLTRNRRRSRRIAKVIKRRREKDEEKKKGQDDDNDNDDDDSTQSFGSHDGSKKKRKSTSTTTGAPATESYVYDLFATSNHTGGLGAGHYTAHVLNSLDNHWYYMDDSKVVLSSEEQLKQRGHSAYMLFYKRREVV